MNTVAQARVCPVRAANNASVGKPSATPCKAAKKVCPSPSLRAAKVAGGVFASQTAAVQATIARETDQVESVASKVKEAVDAVLGVLQQVCVYEELLD